MDDHVILVDENDWQTGTIEKLEAHRRGLLHRAFSIFLFSEDAYCLLQRRASGIYHSGGLWSNACCSHPRPGEDLGEATIRRLKEELGVSAGLEKVLETRYDLDVGNGLREVEYNHTYIGRFDKSAPLIPNPEEWTECRWRKIGDIENDLATRPGDYSAWFVLLFPMVIAYYG
jgi:isopentenyl-diphosphate delta-isomerase